MVHLQVKLEYLFSTLDFDKIDYTKVVTIDFGQMQYVNPTSGAVYLYADHRSDMSSVG